MFVEAGNLQFELGIYTVIVALHRCFTAENSVTGHVCVNSNGMVFRIWFVRPD